MTGRHTAHAVATRWRRTASVVVSLLVGLAVVVAVATPAAAGVGWTLSSSPKPGTGDNQLNGVSCVSTTSCTAVGSYETTTAQVTLVESWNGISWKTVTTPNPGATYNALNGVSCVS